MRLTSKTRQAACWSWTRSGHLFAKRVANGGFGLPSRARRVKSWPMSWATAVKRLVKSYGNAFLSLTAVVIATATSGKPTPTSSRNRNTRRAAKSVARPHMSSDGTTRCGNGWRALSERLYHSPSQIRCMRYVYDCSFIATISHCAPPDFSTTVVFRLR